MKNKNSETNQVAIFSPIYKELILSVGEVDGITRVPPKLNQFDRFSAVIDEILNGYDFENYCHALWTTRLFQSQKFMNAEERRANVSGVFDAIDEVAGKHIVLLDDVITSCATIIEASKTLYAKGASKVTVIVLAVNQHADPVLYSQELYCPECHSKMKMRFSTKRDSSAYFGCSKYPSCKNWHSYYSGLRRRRIEGNISRELAWDDIIF